MSVSYRQLKQLITQEDFIKFSHCESSRSYMLRRIFGPKREEVTGDLKKRGGERRM
jgi:hypothetical protein